MSNSVINYLYWFTYLSWSAIFLIKEIFHDYMYNITTLQFSIEKYDIASIYKINIYKVWVKFSESVFDNNLHHFLQKAQVLKFTCP